MVGVGANLFAQYLAHSEAPKNCHSRMIFSVIDRRVVNDCRGGRVILEATLFDFVRRWAPRFFTELGEYQEALTRLRMTRMSR